RIRRAPWCRGAACAETGSSRLLGRPAFSNSAPSCIPAFQPHCPSLKHPAEAAGKRTAPPWIATCFTTEANVTFISFGGFVIDYWCQKLARSEERRVGKECRCR